MIIKVIPEIENSEGWVFKVGVQDEKGATSHRVTLVKYDYSSLTGGKVPPVELMRKSFEFLLARESKEKILKEFNLMEISRYFPEYKKFIRDLVGK